MTKSANTAGKIMKKGRVVILLAGRYAGKKGVIVNVHEQSNAGRKFPHALIAGIDRHPRKVHKKMSKKRMDRKLKIKPFIKYVNLNHLMPTRYQMTNAQGMEGFGEKVQDVAKHGSK